MEVKCEKPEYTQEMKNKLNLMYKTLKKGYHTKQELMDLFGLGERQIRMLIAEVSHRFPIISNSGTNVGYKICTSEEDLKEVEHTLAELSSRCEEIQKRMQPLYAFRDKVKYNIGE